MNTRNTLDFEQTYAILEELGRGGGGTVYKAYHKRLKKEVVLKKIHSDLKEINARNEADILKNLKSPYLPQVIDFIERDGDVFTVMEFIEGKSLKECLEMKMVFAQQDVVKWFRQLAEALTILHSQRPCIVHGDIKPANIMLTPAGDVCLIDFNVSSIFDGKVNRILGYTPAYAAPEQMQAFEQSFSESFGQGNDEFSAGIGGTDDDFTAMADENSLEGGSTLYMFDEQIIQKADEAKKRRAVSEVSGNMDPRTDIYGLGATMYHVLSGIQPDSGNLQDIREVSKEIKEPLAYIVMKCIQRLPQDRFASAEELLHALENVYLQTTAYQNLLARQRMMRVALLAVTVVSFATACLGVQRIQQERDIAYSQYVQMETDARIRNQNEPLEEAFTKAITVFPERSDAYIEKGWYLYDAGKYEDAIAFLLEEAEPYVKDRTGIANIDYLIGKCYSEQGKYVKAHDYFQQSLQQDPTNIAAYQEDAITMARTGDIGEAEELLASAGEYGLGNDGITYTQGEIAFSEGKTKQAEECFTEVKDNTEDAYLQMRAYLMLSSIYKEKKNTLKNCDKRIRLLEEARETVQPQYQSVIAQELAQSYIDRSGLDGNEDDMLAAVDILKEVTDAGYGNYDTRRTIVTLYHNMQKYDEEETELEKMLQEFGEDYRTYMYFAYAEAARQGQLDNGSRSYKQFEEYYQKADSLYAEQKKSNQSDPLMDSLAEIHQDVVNGGWL